MSNYVKVLLMLWFIVGCDNSGLITDDSYIERSVAIPAQKIEPGLYWLPAVDDGFAMSIAKFRREVNNKIVAIVPSDTGGHGRTIGYFIVTEIEKIK